MAAFGKKSMPGFPEWIMPKGRQMIDMHAGKPINDAATGLCLFQ
ncbi:hypothetical protein [Bifidobacterium aquikefiricola]|uniref:Uncharacterized protein n=1 Tax=Bifidobacterium aquikefiricola TaxID=3059038 RepID=A0AB39U6U3_9BIFI